MNFSAPLFIPLFVFGAIVGSFLNVVILRFNTGKSIIGPQERSQCFSCGKRLRWWELVPIVSFLGLRGRCSECKSKISWQYPVVEALTGAVFVLLGLKFFPAMLVGQFVLYALIFSVLIVITFYDLKHKIIPNKLVYAFALLAAGHAVWWFQLGSFSLLDLLAGPLFFAMFALLWLVSGGRWLGFGDAKLVLGIGLMLGLVHGLSALVLAFWIGAAVAIGILILQKCLRGVSEHLTMKSEIPFAPFLILGTAISFFCNTDVLGISRFFF